MFPILDTLRFFSTL